MEPTQKDWTNVETIVSRSCGEFNVMSKRILEFGKNGAKNYTLFVAVHEKSGVTLSGRYLAPLRKRVQAI